MTRKDGPIGVGVLGAGLAFQALHAPSVADLAPDLALHAVWDPDEGRAKAAAGWLGIRPASSCDDLLADPAIDVAVIASPARFHAEQAIAAINAGKRAVLVEKPLCTNPEEAEAIARAAEARGVALHVGAMHLHDPAWLAAEAVLVESQFKPALVRSSIVLPPNSRFENWATEPLLAVPATGGPANMTPGQLMRLGILELAIHDLPLVRRMLPPGQTPRVLAARLRTPFGYAISIAAGDTLVDLTCRLHGHWQTDWALEATGPEGKLKLDFTPSFVSAGSGTMTWEGAGANRHHPGSDANGYARQWQAVVAMLRGQRDLPDPRVAVADFCFAHTIAEQVSALVAEENNA